MNPKDAKQIVFKSIWFKILVQVENERNRLVVKVSAIECKQIRKIRFLPQYSDTLSEWEEIAMIQIVTK